MFRKFFAIITIVLAAFACSVSANAADNQNTLVLKLKNGDVVIKLRSDLAPKHVAQIKKLVQDGAYDNVVFHRVINGFMAQTGDVRFGKSDAPDFSLNYAGMGSSQYPNVPAEFSKVPFKRGTVGMARSSDPNSANSQFFICFDRVPSLDGQYTVVGEVVKGMDAVDKITKGDDRQNGKVANPDKILKATLVANQ